MPLEYRNSDFVLKVVDNSAEVTAKVHKYDAFLDALTTQKFEHVREAVRTAIKYFITKLFDTTEAAATLNYVDNNNAKLRAKYGNQNEYLDKLLIREKKSFTIDLATGTGKSWAIYGVAAIMLSEGLVDKVLVLCPSLTIEEELTKKFELFSGNAVLTDILSSLGACFPTPSIKNANKDILNGDICVENIHAAYQRTGSSIQSSFKGKGERTLVISDEAHHIYSEIEGIRNKWLAFLTNKDYNFKYLLGVTGTPYISDEYFHDVIYRYSLREAMNDGIVKQIDYKIEQESRDPDRGNIYDETYQIHGRNRIEYCSKLKPITIIVTDTILNCIQVWDNLVEYIRCKEKCSRENAASKVIWVTSGLPSNGNEKSLAERILPEAEKARKKNLILLKTVDEPTNPVEWIVSVSMLTEGWDVKNVFQIVPHNNRAFSSKLLISQVLGRGLRIPQGLTLPIKVTVNNHERWTETIRNLYNEVLEIENRLSWKYWEERKQYVFPLYNLDYSISQDSEHIDAISGIELQTIEFNNQERQWEETSTYNLSGAVRFTVEAKDVFSIQEAARGIKLFLKEKDPEVANNWTTQQIENSLVANLESRGLDSAFLSKENLEAAQKAFSKLISQPATKSPRVKMTSDSLVEIKITTLSPQTFSESLLKRNGRLFYEKNSANSLSNEQKCLLERFIKDRKEYSSVIERIESSGGNVSEIEFLQNNFSEISSENFKTPLNLIFVSHSPEVSFIQSVFNNIDLFDSFLKSPDKGFYSFPYSYTPDGREEAYAKQENFNPDFFLKVNGQEIVLVVEIKSDGDIHPKNKAKLTYGLQHFTELNKKLEEVNQSWRYCFYFLSPDDFVYFFQNVKNGNYDWQSDFMRALME